MIENRPIENKPKGRSPAYPAINLEAAIQRARQLYDKERHHPTPVSAIVSHWGYTSLNGAALGAVAALKKYGLLDEEGSGEDRMARLSRLADDILMNPDEAKKAEAIREAALRPAIHREMWEKYHLDLPSDRSLLWALTRDRGFTERGATEFIREYRATIAFAELETEQCTSAPPVMQDASEAEDDRDDDDNWDSEPARPSNQRRRPPVLQGSGMQAENVKSYAVPLVDNGSITVEGQFPISERDWEQFIAVLTAMKPGLVSAISDGSANV